MSLLETTIGLLAPPQCINCQTEGQDLCSSCISNYITAHGQRCYYCNGLSQASRTCQKCVRRERPSSVWIASDYQDITQELIRQYKFLHRRSVAKTLAEIMCSEMQSQVDVTTLHSYLVVPVPTATSRVRERGFDHSLLLAKEVSALLGLPYFNALGRLGQSRQVGSTKASRQKQTTGSYFVRRKTVVKDRSILLIDDVLTTGSTIQATTMELKNAGAVRVNALIFAKKL